MAKKNVEKKLQAIADEIRTRSMTEPFQVFEIGKLLTAAQGILQGRFMDWVKSRFTFSQRTAKHCMAVYQNCVGTPEAIAHFQPTELYVIRRRGFPRELREHLLENPKKITDTDT